MKLLRIDLQKPSIVNLSLDLYLSPPEASSKSSVRLGGQEHYNRILGQKRMVRASYAIFSAWQYKSKKEKSRAESV